MLEDLTVKDFALIDEVSLDFSEGFTVLSGETGAGKSILIGAVTFLLGGKGGLEIIRTGSREASVSGTLRIGKSCRAAYDWLDEHSIDHDEGRVLLRRVIRDTGKSSAWIQGIQVTKNDLAEFTSYLVDIHGQHEHQSLMYPASHRGFLDSYAGLTDQVAAFSKLYSELVAKRNLLDELNSSGAEWERKIEMLSFAVEEITQAALHPGEDEELDAEEKRLAQYEKLYSDVDEVDSSLSGGENIISVLKKARTVLSHAAGIDGSIGKLSERMENAFYELSDISEELKSYKNSLVYDPVRLDEVQERSALIFKLKKKYAASQTSPVSDVIKYGEDAQAELDKMQGSRVDSGALSDEIKKLERTVLAEAAKLSSARKEKALSFASAVMEVLSKLGMANTVFEVGITKKPGDTDVQRCGPYGFDDIEFLISANPGSPLKPLAKIASGGELSRVMLALKTILSASDMTDTLVFDEIDTGIGGEIAAAVGHHLRNLSHNHQILCITHLASIAVCADNQIKIEKIVSDGNTSTHVHPVEGNERVAEIARMLSGDAVSEASLLHAASLLKENKTF
ncbi:MAG: DNA repair protein RecN [Treponemataceae bacterium]|nr:DNA repair protein RecN [Treponemataceae bacterium]